MKIIVLVKQVPARDAALRVAADGRHLDESALTYEMNGPDAYALEAALRLRDSMGAEVVALSAGPDRVTQTIREALAKGADRGIHIRFEKQIASDAFGIASLIAKAVKPEAPDLIFTGLQSEDANSGQTGVIAAELLGFAHATIVTSVELLAGSIRVRRELEGGWHQFVTLPLPAVLTIQSGIQKSRLATMLGIKQAKAKDIQVLPASAWQVKRSAAVGLNRIYHPERKTTGSVLRGDPRECARQLVELLRSEGRLP